MRQLKKDEVHIWIGEASPSIENCLNPEEQRRAKCFVTPLLQQRFVYARSNLRKLLSYYSKLPPQEITIAYHPQGKPYLPDHPEIQFNLAHTKEIVVYAFSLHHPLGIDIEYKRPRAFNDIAARFFTESEYQALQKLEENAQLDLFYQIWARKEALIKATGQGLSYPLNSFNVPLEERNRTITLEDQTWSISSIQTPKMYAAALASAHPNPQLFYFDVNRDLDIKDEL